ncbi:MAG TPA: sulfide/dihydroorotate dehydrogenase-like FAD/NAD-binding protein [Ignavibacteriales bacterium]|nr:sulfide/dihydroorotate dehydrogenase-like FAD/NAD-binding protein [Ignavibacteriales bacterium]
MFKIVEASFVGPNVKKFEIEAPQIAKKRKAGQFVILRVSDKGERIPLTIADSNTEKGTITIMVQGVGKSTIELNHKEKGDYINDLVGPLGNPTHIENFGKVVVVGGGVGTAIAYPVAKALKEIGNYTITIIGGRSKEYVILENEMRAFCDEVHITTDDGSYGMKGFVTDKLKELIEHNTINFVLAIGPISMMRNIALLTKEYGIQTVVSLNPIMIDGTGMCGGCRVNVGGKTVFACVDGPEFDAHLVDFDTLMKRNRQYIMYEQEALHICKLEQQITDLRKSGV